MLAGGPAVEEALTERHTSQRVMLTDWPAFVGPELTERQTCRRALTDWPVFGLALTRRRTSAGAQVAMIRL
jgi:hypothetical protein